MKKLMFTLDEAITPKNKELGGVWFPGWKNKIFTVDSIADAEDLLEESCTQFGSIDDPNYAPQIMIIPTPNMLCFGEDDSRDYTAFLNGLISIDMALDYANKVPSIMSYDDRWDDLHNSCLIRGNIWVDNYAQIDKKDLIDRFSSQAISPEKIFDGWKQQMLELDEPPQTDNFAERVRDLAHTLRNARYSILKACRDWNECNDDLGTDLHAKLVGYDVKLGVVDEFSAPAHSGIDHLQQFDLDVLAECIFALNSAYELLGKPAPFRFEKDSALNGIPINSDSQLSEADQAAFSEAALANLKSTLSFSADILENRHYKFDSWNLTLSKGIISLDPRGQI